ncbi:MAG: hypothetical protein A3K19_18935 [Lentisphaerae bacterium RIFOXYB12_FULL_65_16]|nr:MAG: hypothetical protein A3K18_23115 [Lentisphaerae bacterium RIFOXYA12_64_32]OGV86852.1 MAG: hypothetical protein A3K19_18935 [Lentisphaerae bacterium RIFOXYB12_FULL_65_16]
MKTHSIRLPEEIMSSLAYVEKKEHVEQATAIRKLLRLGLETYVALQYRQGKLTLAEAAENLNLPAIETFELLIERGVNGNLDAADVMGSIKSLKL